MKVSCACPVESEEVEMLTNQLACLGIQPIVTAQVFRAVYEGDRKVGEKVVDLFSRVPSHDVYFSYDKSEQDKPTRRAIRKQKKRR